MNHALVSILFLASLFLVPAGASGTSLLQEEAPDHTELEQGREMFVRYCASCHGLDAKGDGPAAPSLKAPPSDLTRLQGLAERFPRSRVRDIIDGERIISAHGSRTMPVWGRVLRDTGDYGQAQDEILLIVQYVESIQVIPTSSRKK